MAQFIDEREEETQLEEGEELQTLTETAEAENTEEVDTEEETEEPEVPDKYRDKSIQDIIAMHQNAEQLLGKQGQEVGELRKIVDDFIQSQTIKQETAHSVDEEFDETDFFTNPKDAITKLLENHPSIKQSQELSVQLKQQEAMSKLQAAHPNFMDVVKDPKFAEWVGKSKVRTRLLKEADQQYDFDAADELLTLWQERQETLKSTVSAEKETRKDRIKSASTGASQGSGERPSRKIYRRADLIELMQKDPQRYEALMPEIRQAYAEGRVKS